MAIALLAKLRSLHTATIQYQYIVLTLLRIIAISLHTYLSCTIRLEPALTYLRWLIVIAVSDDWSGKLRHGHAVFALDTQVHIELNINLHDKMRHHIYM